MRILSILFLSVLIVSAQIGLAQEYQINGSLGLGTNPANDKKLDVDGDTKMRGSAEVDGEIKLTSKPHSPSLLDNLFFLDENKRMKTIGEDSKTVELLMDIYNPFGYCDLQLPNGDVFPFWTSIQGQPGIMHLCSNSRLGVGTDSPIAKLHVAGNTFLDGETTSSGHFQALNGASFEKPVTMSMYSGETGQMLTLEHDNGDDVFSFSTDGTARFTLRNPQMNFLELYSETMDDYALVVNSLGHLYTSRVIVENIGNFPDYVFEKDYKLMSLHALREFIKANKKLPNMPSAKNVAENGADLGELNRLLVEKVEELTLYVLQLESRLSSLEEEGNSSK